MTAHKSSIYSARNESTVKEKHSTATILGANNWENVQQMGAYSKYNFERSSQKDGKRHLHALP